MSKPAPHYTCYPVPYSADSLGYFGLCRHWPYPVWLDSGRPQASFGRFDILSAHPSVVLKTYGSETTIEKHQQLIRSKEPALQLLAAELAHFPTHEPSDLPFTGGALGYIGYHLASQLEPRAPYPTRDIKLPDMVMGIYHWAIVQDHHLQTAYIVATADCDPILLNELLALTREVDPHARSADASTADTQAPETPPFAISNFRHRLDKPSYLARLATIHHYISAGDCYQVNFAQRFSADYQGDPFTLYQAVRQQLPAPYASFMAFPEGAVLCHSPERFLLLNQCDVETRPIKGTAPRSEDLSIDAANAQRLLTSAKDRAENVMIVDLLRNDLSKTCKPGSVATPQIGALESYANVHHLVSTVTGKLRPEETPLSLLEGCFPGGSITGAPKLRAMQIIAELEQLERSVYCGSMGYIGFNGRMDMNIAIRTLVCDQQQIHCWGGGGIVADSIAEAEYQESLDKVGLLLAVMERFQRDS